jgi:hypothetical protein
MSASSSLEPEAVREFLQQLRNLQLIRRNGMHKYNNQDHSMLTAILAVKNIVGANHNLWDVNVAQEYHEELFSDEENAQVRACALTQPPVPQRINEPGYL